MLYLRKNGSYKYSLVTMSWICYTCKQSLIPWSVGQCHNVWLQMLLFLQLGITIDLDSMFWYVHVNTGDEGFNEKEID